MVQTRRLKDGTPYTLREAGEEDAPALIDYLAAIAGESDNLTFGPGDFAPTDSEERAYLKSLASQSNSIMILALIEGRIIGCLSVTGGHRKRLAHSGEMAITVLKEYWRNRIADSLMEALLGWAQTVPLTKISLKVREDNAAALCLYQKYNFEIEGLQKRDMLIDGVYHNSLIMAKFLGD